jgi:hypothetical protein
MKYIEYSNQNELFITTEQDEPAFRARLLCAGYDLDPENGDFNRAEHENDHVSIYVSQSFGVENPASYEL